MCLTSTWNGMRRSITWWRKGLSRYLGIGVSMGGTSLMQVAAYRTEFTAVSAISSPNVFPNKAPKDSDRASEDGFDKLDGLANVADIQVPKLYMVGARNQCSYWQSNRYFKRAGEPVRLVIYETRFARHGDPRRRRDWSRCCAGGRRFPSLIRMASSVRKSETKPQTPTPTSNVGRLRMRRTTTRS